MVVEASVTGLFRTIVIIVAILVVARFMSKLLAEKREMAAREDFERKKKDFEKTKKVVEKEKGKTRILGKKTSSHEDGEYVDFEEIKD